jgi:hypothetical protein
MNAPPKRNKAGYYTLPDGQKCLSVTNVIKFGVPKDLTEWAAWEVANAAVEAVPKLSRMRGSSARWEMIRYLQETPNRKRDAAGDFGTAIHDIAEAYVLGKPIGNPEPDQTPFVQAFENFLEDHQPVYHAAELVVAHPEHGWAGRCDAWCELPKLPGFDGVISVIDYKGLALDTPLPTPTGWTTMRDVQVGDTLFGSNGRPCTVTAKSEVHWRQCYRIRFDDTSSVICDDEHLWMSDHGPGGKTRRSVLTTDEIRRTLTLGGQKQHRIPIAGALDLPPRELPIHPYVLGCWLGDGKATSGEVSKPDAELFENIEACGYRVGPDYYPDGCRTSTIYGLRTQLRKADLLGQKRMPGVYLRSGYDQRLALMRGLMDTDGSWNSERKQAVFCSSDKALALQFQELACSLGQRALLQEVKAHGFGLDVITYKVVFSAVEINPFRLSRKANLVQPAGSRSLSRRRMVIEVESVPTVPTQCITVDSPDNTYLCTESMIPTHNTGKNAYPEACLQLSCYQRAIKCWLDDGTEGLPPAAVNAFVLHIRPDKYPDRGYALIPCDTSDEVYGYFRAAQQVAEWNMSRSKSALGDAVELEAV